MIDFVLKKDLYKLLFYIKKYWNKNHIFLKDINVFNSQHNTNYSYYNFLSCARNDELTSIMGLININRDSNKQIWIALWHSISGLDGYLLLNYLLKNIKPDFIGVIGITKIAINIYKIKGFEINYLSHYYVSKPDTKLKLLNTNLIIKKTDEKFEVTKNINLDLINKLNTNTYAPFKEDAYYIERYKNNQFYDYKFLNIYNNDVIKIILIGRVVDVQNLKLFHCVDCIGELNNVKIKYIIQQFIIKFNFDVFELLFYSNSLNKIDLFLKSNNEIIPSYFNPFINQNKKIDIAYLSKHKNVRFFIGDSDQDRPN
jgi:hypothetical protein